MHLMLKNYKWNTTVKNMRVYNFNSKPKLNSNND